MRAPPPLLALALLLALAAPPAHADDPPAPPPAAPKPKDAPKTAEPPKAARLRQRASRPPRSRGPRRGRTRARRPPSATRRSSSTATRAPARPCKTIHRVVYGDPAYARWANEKTIHAISYWLDPNDELPEEDVERERDGEKVLVIARHPALTRAEAETFVNDVDKAVKFPTKTPWAGVIAPDGTTILAEIKTGQAKDFRALYDAQQKKLGAQLPRATWRAIRKDLAASFDAEFDDKWAEAVTHAIAARDAGKDAPKPLAERIATRVEAVEKEGAKRLAAAKALPDAAARAKAYEAIASTFKGLPCAEQATAAADGEVARGTEPERSPAARIGASRIRHAVPRASARRSSAARRWSAAPASPYGRARSIDPSSVEVHWRAASRALPAKDSAPSARPRSSTFASQASFASKNARIARCIGCGSVSYSAASMPQRHIRSAASTSP